MLTISCNITDGKYERIYFYKMILTKEGVQLSSSEGGFVVGVWPDRQIYSYDWTVKGMELIIYCCLAQKEFDSHFNENLEPAAGPI